MIFEAFYLSLKLAFISTSVLLVICTPLALWLAKNKTWYKALVEAFVMLPLVLPPTVLGFYLLILLNPQSKIGTFWHSITGDDLVFHFSGLVVGSVIYSLPFVILPIKIAFEDISDRYIEAAATLRASYYDRFFHVLLPLAKHGYYSGFVFGFAHTLGEFGVVLMIGGNIPGETQVISIAIYDQVEQLNYQTAYLYSGIMLIASACLMILLYIINRYTRSSRLWQS